MATVSFHIPLTRREGFAGSPSPRCPRLEWRLSCLHSPSHRNLLFLGAYSDRKASESTGRFFSRLGMSCATVSVSPIFRQTTWPSVYENTLVTPETRKHFGTHSTPRQLAEYAVVRLELHHHEPDSLHIYEPFTGAGTFLISALRHMRDLLPLDWSDQRRHDFLINRLAGDEIDSFAREVSTLSLILADYPNRNGWRIAEADLFEDGMLQARLRGHNVVLCNPPFEDFKPEERSRYPIASEHLSKPMVALNAALDVHPLALAFVLPRSFILDRKFAEQRRKVETLYGDVELVELPDRVFGASVIESALLIAKEPRPPASARITLRVDRSVRP